MTTDTKSPQKPTFDEWMNQVDKACWARYGLSVHDLADCSFYDWFEDGVRPSTAARRAGQAF